MGTFSRHHRYREAGEEANINNIERFGQPARSLFTSTKLFTLRHRIEVTDGYENVVYRAETMPLSLRDKTDIFDAEGRFVAHMEKKIFSIHRRHFITMADGKAFEVTSELFHLIKDIMNIPGLGWQIRGNVLGLNFEIYDENEEIIAVIAQKIFSIHDKYCIDIYRPEHEETVVAILVTLQHMIRDRAAAASSSSSGSASGG